MPITLDVPCRSKVVQQTNKRAFLYPPRKEKRCRKNHLSLIYLKFLKSEQSAMKETQIKLKHNGPDLKSLQLEIEILRIELHNLASQKGFVDQSVVNLSQKLDKYIVLYQHLMPGI